MNKRQYKKHFKSTKLNILEVIYNHVKEISDEDIFRRFTMFAIMKESKLTWGYREKFDKRWLLDFKYVDDMYVNSKLQLMSRKLREDFIYLKNKMK